MPYSFVFSASESAYLYGFVSMLLLRIKYAGEDLTNLGDLASLAIKAKFGADVE